MQRRSDQALDGDHRLVVGGKGVEVLPADAEECSLGVEQLEEYLAEIEAEAQRVRAKIAEKKDYLDGAEKFFKN